jgi:hypothetical protein
MPVKTIGTAMKDAETRAAGMKVAVTNAGMKDGATSTEMKDGATSTEMKVAEARGAIRLRN